MCANKRSWRKKSVTIKVYRKTVAALCGDVPLSNSNDTVYH